METPCDDTVICATPQHTGTWFLIGILEKMLARETVLLPNAVHDLTTLETNNLLVHYHLQGSYFPPLHIFNAEITRPLCQRITVNGDRQPFFQDFEIDAGKYKTVISMRDPIMSLLTRQTRHPKGINRNDIVVQDHLTVVHGFIQAAKAYEQPNIFVFPIDLPMRLDERLQLITELHGFLDVQYSRADWEGFAKVWQKQNATTDLSTKYCSDFDYSDIPEKTAYVLHRAMASVYTLLEDEIQLLNSHPEITQMLLRLGYPRLPWM